MKSKSWLFKKQAFLPKTIFLYYTGQLISKCLLGTFNSSKKTNKKLDLTTYYGISSQIVFVCFLEELKMPKRHLEIN